MDSSCLTLMQISIQIWSLMIHGFKSFVKGLRKILWRLFSLLYPLRCRSPRLHRPLHLIMLRQCSVGHHIPRIITSPRLLLPHTFLLTMRILLQDSYCIHHLITIIIHSCIPSLLLDLLSHLRINITLMRLLLGGRHHLPLPTAPLQFESIILHLLEGASKHSLRLLLLLLNIAPSTSSLSLLER